jgi:hypothetical protein
MSKRYRKLFVAVLAALGLSLGTGFMAVPAQANGPHALCNYQSPGQCMNRNGGGTGISTKVIGWTRDYDNNEDFEFFLLSGMCDAGHVSVDPGCPFSDPDNNMRYNHDPIYGIRTYANNNKYCVGTNTQGLAILNQCPQLNGNGGSNGDIFVLSTQSYLVNRYWTNKNACLSGGPCWVCVFVHDTQLTLKYYSAQPACQWSQDKP